MPGKSGFMLHEKDIDGLMKEAVSGNVFPGGVLLVSVGGDVVFFKAYGVENLFSGSPVTKETIFDLASLTKPLATTLSVMILIQRSDLTLKENLGAILPAFKNTDKAKIRIEHLLYHNSGFPDYRPYYKRLQNLDPRKRKDALRELLVKEPLVHPPGRQVVYSDLGFMVLCWVVETVSGIRLDHFVMENICRPLNLKHLFFVPVDVKPQRSKFAATERCPWRGFLLEGVVHDDNAYSVGGIDGHAGLFGTAEDVFYLLSDLSAGYRRDAAAKIFDSELTRCFLSRDKHTGRALGFDTPSLVAPSCGRFFSKRTIGHLGFTGTSFWMDLDRNITVILFTNRVHPSRDNNRIKAFRPILHDAVMENFVTGESS
jgi:CubicO group peptidase (beta-lactamase class C family)